MVGDLIHFKTENSSELSKLDNTDNLNVVEEMTVNNIEQDISNSTGNLIFLSMFTSANNLRLLQLF